MWLLVIFLLVVKSIKVFSRFSSNLLGRPFSIPLYETLSTGFPTPKCSFSSGLVELLREAILCLAPKRLLARITNDRRDEEGRENVIKV